MSMNVTNAVQASKDYLNIEPPKSLTEQAWAKSNLGVKITMVALATIFLPLSAIFAGIDFLVKHFRVLSFNKEHKAEIELIKEAVKFQGIFRNYRANKAAVKFQAALRGYHSRKPELERQVARVLNEMNRQTANDPTATVVVTGAIRDDLNAVNAFLGPHMTSGQVNAAEYSDGYESVATTPAHTDTEEE